MNGINLLAIRNHHGTILSQPDVSFYAGQIIIAKKFFTAGGGGYIISRPALKRFVEDGIPICNPHTVSSEEDRYVSYCCFTDTLKVTFIDAADDNGKQRFHNYSPDFIVFIIKQ